MKINNRKIYSLSGLVILTLMISCVGDLNVQPSDPFVATANVVYTDVASYKQGLAKLYAAFALTGAQGPSGNGDVGGVDEGFSDFIRSLWNMNELTTDEAVWTYPNDANGTIFNLHYHSWVPSDVIPTALFARIMNVAALTNEFIRATAGKNDPDLKQFHAEARFLRALAYYYGIDLFGDMPFVTEADLPGSYAPPKITRANLFAYVESELKAIHDELGAPGFEYGRADKTACSMLLAKLYLNAAVYINTPMYNETVLALNEVIASGYYTLSPKYANIFRADNDTNSKEIIFAQTFDGNRSQAYDIVQVMIKGNAGGGDGGWSGLRATSAFVNKFTNLNEARAIFNKENTGQSLDIDAVNTSTQGYGVWKFRDITAIGTGYTFTVTKANATVGDTYTNNGQTFTVVSTISGGTKLVCTGTGVPSSSGTLTNSSGTGDPQKTDAAITFSVVWDGLPNPSGNTTFPDTDFPMFRLADAYLMYAEAVLRGATPGPSDPLTLVNAIRTRSGDVAAGNAPGAITQAQLTLDFILDERARELYWEGHRRTDLIRFGKFTGSAYLWPWKGGIKNGASIEDKRVLFPIPAADIANNPNLKQNEGY